MTDKAKLGTDAHPHIGLLVYNKILSVRRKKIMKLQGRKNFVRKLSQFWKSRSGVGGKLSQFWKSRLQGGKLSQFWKSRSGVWQIEPV